MTCRAHNSQVAWVVGLLACAASMQDRRDATNVVDFGRNTEAAGVAQPEAVLVTVEDTSPHMCGCAAAAGWP